MPATLLKVKPSIVGVGTFAPLRQPRSVFYGTGWAVADGRHVVTNLHVIRARRLDAKVKEAHAIFVPSPDHEPRAYRAQPVVYDRHHDLCLLRVEGVRLPPLKLGHARDVEEGRAYAMTGFPIGMVLGLHPATHQGIVAAITPVAIPALPGESLKGRFLDLVSAPFKVFQLDAIAYPGNSGSPLYEEDTGRVVGVVNSVFVKGGKENALEHPSGISYAIPVTYVYDLLNKAHLEP